MSAVKTTCPPESLLSDFGLGKLDAANVETISRHLETCVDCRQRVAGLSGDSFVGRLREAGGAAQPAPKRERTYVPGESLANAANSTDGSSASDVGQPPSLVGREDGLHRPSRSSDDVVPQDGLGSPSSVSAPPELANHPDYELIKELGQGGMGTVYLAKNRMMDRPEVLKVISQAVLNKPGVRERFLQEIRAVANLDHPNIVAAYSVSRLGDSLTFAMAYVKGQNLEQVVNARGPLPVANAAFYIHQVALGLQHAHEKGKVHRDIKPNNLMLTIDGKKHVVKILDFGLAKAMSEKDADWVGDARAGDVSGATAGLTRIGQMLGTPDYVAPEQMLDAHGADTRADIYSLGCTLYFLLSGGPPFQEATLGEILEAHHKRDPKPLNLVRPEVPVELAAVVARMMAKDPTKRYQTPAEVAKALTPFFKPGQSVTTPPMHAAEPAASTETIHGLDAATAISPVTPPLGAVVPGTPATAPIAVTQTGKPSSANRRRPPAVAIAVAAGFLAILLGVIVIIRDYKGKEIARVESPAGATVEVRPSPEKPAETYDGIDRRRIAPSDGEAPGESLGEEEKLQEFIQNPTFAEGLSGWNQEQGTTGFHSFLMDGQPALTTWGMAKDKNTGRIYQQFRVPRNAKELTFYVHGGNRPGLYVALKRGQETIFRVTGQNSNELKQVTWNLQEVRGKPVTLEIVDEATGGWGFIGVHGFQIVRSDSDVGIRPIELALPDAQPPSTENKR